MLEHVSTEISQAVLQAVLYSDIFDFPLTVREVHRYLPGIVASYEDVCEVLSAEDRFVKTGDFVTLAGREHLVNVREEREDRSKKLFPYALKYGRIIGRLPFVRMVALTGSLAVRNVSGNIDLDYMLVTRPGRLWTARAFSLLFGRFTKILGHTVCPNLIVSENYLEWHQRDLYTAREFSQMIPISGREIYLKLMSANVWIKDFLPNAYREPKSLLLESRGQRAFALQKLLEFLLRGELGNRLEQWEMQRKITRFSKQDRFGDETVFTADICQGNFDHHRKWTEEQLELRNSKFNVDMQEIRQP